mgnify:FL=1
MSQEQFNYEMSAYKGGFDMISNLISAGTGNVGALTTSGTQAIDMNSLDVNHEYYIKNMMAQQTKQSLLPDSASLSSSGATLLGYNKMTRNVFGRYNISSEFAQKIDRYFDLYGYQVNNVKIPNRFSRNNWNYVKTQGCNIYGDIPEIDLQAIIQLFDNGITLWHNTKTFLDYSQDNI